MTVKTQMALVGAGVLLFAILAVAIVAMVPVSMYDDAQVVGLTEQIRSWGHEVILDEVTGRSSAQPAASIESGFHALRDGDSQSGIERQDERLLSTLTGVAEKWTAFQETLVAYRTSHDPTRLVAADDAFQQAVEPLIAEARGEAQRNITRLGRVPWVLGTLGVLLVGFLWMVYRRAASQLMHTVDSLAQTSSTLAVTLEEQARVASQQAVATNETTATMEELRASAGLSAEQAQSAASQSRQVLQLSQEGNTAMEQTADGIERLRSRVEAFSQHILKLSEQVSQIGTITVQVGDLANQTNMLALNAAVEAVRAGDQGRGFAVVAAEIRKLADQSRRSAERIGGLVGDIQQATNATVMIAEQGIRNAEDTTQLTHKASNSLKVMESSMTSIYDSVQQISLNARQQSEAVRQVLDAVSSLNSGAQESANSMAQTQQGIARLDTAAQGLRTLVGLR